MSTKVLHILPHVGGGVGSVIRALLQAETKNGESRFSHSVVSLDTLNEPSKTSFKNCGIPWIECAGKGEIEGLVNRTDLVLAHWWNHPLLMKVLSDGLPPSRLAFWSHVNGYSPPQSFFAELFEMPDLFIFASKVSYNSPVVNGLSEERRNRLRVIRSCAGIPEMASEPCIASEPFQIGYVGTVEPAKMHPNFLHLCAAADIQSPCIVAGGPLHDKLRLEAEILGWGKRFEILGPVADPMPIFKRIHVFAYPLAPGHYGTGEQVLIEAMASGAVPVVLANPPEKALIRDRGTGIVAESHSDFSAALKFLANNPSERERMAEEGRRFVLEKCDIRRSQSKFHAIFDELGSFPKRARSLSLPEFGEIKTGSPFHLFLSSCGNNPEREAALVIASGKSVDGNIPPSFHYATRGTPAHYLRMLGPDSRLERICKICGFPETQ